MKKKNPALTAAARTIAQEQGSSLVMVINVGRGHLVEAEAHATNTRTRHAAQTFLADLVRIVDRALGESCYWCKWNIKHPVRLSRAEKDQIKKEVLAAWGNGVLPLCVRDLAARYHVSESMIYRLTATLRQALRLKYPQAKSTT